MKKFNQARVNGGSNYDSTLLGSIKQRESVLLVFKLFEGDTVKLRENPKALSTAPTLKNVVGHQGNDLGYGNNLKDVNNGQSAAKS